MQIRQFLAFDTKLANNDSETSQIEKKTNEITIEQQLL